jgi:hypothetical protein
MALSLFDKSFLGVSVAASLWLSPVWALAHVADISISVALKTVTVSGVQTPRGVKQTGQATSYEGTDPATTSATGPNTDSKGDATINVSNLSTQFGAKGKVTVGDETWSGLIVNGSIQRGIQSDQEKKPTKGFNIGPLDFTPSFDSLLAANSGFSYNTFTVINDGVDGYLITNLQLYTGLDLAFFTSSTFASPAAISSGTLYDDIIADLGGALTIGPAGDLISLSANLVSDDTYSLLTADVQEILPNGELGLPQAVDIAATAVPEPSAWALMMLGLAGVGFAGVRASRRGVSITAG